MTTEQKAYEPEFWKRVNKNGPIPTKYPELGPCWLWTGGISDTGYGNLVDPSNRAKRIAAHRLAWELANNQDIPKGLRVLHRCDVRKCCRPEHLFIGTQRDNILDALRKGKLEPQRQVFKRLWREQWSGVRCGANIHCSKLTESDVREIKRIYALGDAGYKTIGDQFGISFGSVRDIIKGTSWAHVK